MMLGPGWSADLHARLLPDAPSEIPSPGLRLSHEVSTFGAVDQKPNAYLNGGWPHPLVPFLPLSGSGINLR